MIEIDGVEISEETTRAALKAYGVTLKKPEAKKPKPLEHGDCGIDYSGCHDCDWVHLNGETIYRNGIISSKEADDLRLISEKAFNVFDDMEVMKPLEEFDVRNEGIRMVGGNRWFSLKKIDSKKWSINCRSLCFPLLKLAEIHGKLGQVIYKAKLDAAKTWKE